MAERRSLLAKFLARARFMGHWRCREPVVVLESDDWGLDRRPCASLLTPFGEPSEWADEASETAEDLQQLYAVLSSYQDPDGRSPCFTANFIVANPDLEAVERSAYTEYTEIPIGQDPDLLNAWREGFARRVFYPQYHGRSHFWIYRWLRDLQEDVPGARALLKAGCQGGLALVKGKGWSYRSEYRHYGQRGDLVGPGVKWEDWIQGGIGIFEGLFGFRPRSMIAPHYVLDKEAVRMWKKVRGEFIQGAGYRLLPYGSDGVMVYPHVLGEKSPDGVIYLVRTLKYEPRPGRPDGNVKKAVAMAVRSFEIGLPVVIDTHRINYTGGFRQGGLDALYQFLNGIQPHRPRFLTSVELGEAVGSGGRYLDVWSEEEHRLTPSFNPLGNFVRRGLESYHHFIDVEYKERMTYVARKNC